MTNFHRWLLDKKLTLTKFCKITSSNYSRAHTWKMGTGKPQDQTQYRINHYYPDCPLVNQWAMKKIQDGINTRQAQYQKDLESIDKWEQKFETTYTPEEKIQILDHGVLPVQIEILRKCDSKTT